MNLVAILAGGVGARMGMSRPKQFLEFAGRTVLEHSVQAFENHPAVDKILIVMNSDYVDEAKTIIKRNNWPKVCGVIIGGNNRYDSSAAAIDYFLGNAPNDKILIHDAARPLVSAELITRVFSALDKYDAVNVGITPTNTIVEINGKRPVALSRDGDELVSCCAELFRLAVVQCRSPCAVHAGGERGAEGAESRRRGRREEPGEQRVWSSGDCVRSGG